jgi:transcriptional regulator with XRE-family HTH domain
MNNGEKFKTSILDAQNMSMSHAASIMGISRDSLSNWIRGKANLSPRLKEALKKHFDYDVSIHEVNNTCVNHPDWGKINMAIDEHIEQSENEETTYFVTFTASFDTMNIFGRDMITMEGKVENMQDIEAIEEFLHNKHYNGNKDFKINLLNYKEL